MGRALEAAKGLDRYWVELLELRRCSGSDLVERRCWERSDARRSSSVGAGEEDGHGGAQKLSYGPKLATKGLGGKNEPKGEHR